ncbi:MAG: PQQ-binding-like beta-propeller repeat protein, partial [Actinomycetota bacterium]
MAVIGLVGLRFQFQAAIDRGDAVPVTVDAGAGPPAGPEVAADVGGDGSDSEDGTATRSLDTSADENGGGDGRIGGGGDGADDPLWVNPRSSGLPWSSLGAVDGLLTFRGNPTRTYHGSGPVPTNPEILWERTIGCSNSPVGGVAKQWCGTGWTGQPAVFPRPAVHQNTEGDGAGDDGADQAEGADYWVAVGAYNRQVNFFDPDNGTDVYPSVATGDIIKGTITIDPDGYPLVYTGSRDNFFHIAAIDGNQPRELWRLSSIGDEPTLWNNDWDSSAMVVGGHLFVGGENSRFYVIELNRSYDEDGLVVVDPEVVFSTAGWDADLLAAVGNQVSIENSVAISGTVVYFTNSGGLVQGWDVGGLTEGREPDRVFRYWTGDDTDASIVVDGDGFLYVASEFERGNQRARDLGQVFKLDPSQPDDPLVWSRPVTTRLGGGVWATPAIHRDVLIVPTDGGEVFGFHRDTGDVRWQFELDGPLWSSPVVVDDVYIQGDCNGVLHAFDVSDTTRR